jgi:hypothetical protein
MITVNLDKAKGIHKEKLRVLRKPLLDALDIEIMKNITDQSKIAEIEVQKQTLRDITKLVDVATCVEELQTIGVI